MIHRPTHHGPRSWAAHGIVPGDCAARAAAAPRWPVSAAFFVVGLCSWNVMGIAITWGSMLENHLSIYINIHLSIKHGALRHNFRTVAMFLGSLESLWLGKSWYLIGIS